jgi:TP901 family phage tail tape measure protein
MADETISTRIVANADFSALIADVHKVTASLSKLQEQLANSNKMLANQIAVMNRSFSDTLRSTGQFSTHFVSLQSDVEKFGKNLDGGKLKLNQYFNTFRDHAKQSGGVIRDLAKQQVALQNSILQPLGRNAQGLMQFNVHVPRGLDEVKNKAAIARQELQIMNKVLQDGAGQLINWGKNTQWAGRQLTVGLTVPLAAFGAQAAKAFREADQELVRLTKVYGDVAGTSAAELGRVRKDVSETAKQISAAMGVSFKETIGLAADIAATGKTGNELLGSIQETTRLAVLGEVDRQEAMKATLAIQSAFKQNTEELSQSINFLNAVENQTSTTLNDLVEAIPKAGPVIQGLGGSVQDLALYLTAMREGGINASEGANALKSALASLINPTDVAVGKFQDLGINLLSIVNDNAGDLTGTLMELQGALDSLDPLQKQQAIEQLFGKFQFSRLNALFENLGRQGSQTLKVLDLMKASSSELASVADRELSAVTESASGKYRRALESLKASLAEVGEQFLTINTVLIQVIDKVVQFANNLPKPVKQVLALLGGITAIIGPFIMLTGVLANFFGYLLKGAAHLRAFFKGGEGWKYLTPEMLAAEKAGKLVEQSFYSDAKAAAVLKQALGNLIDEFAVLEAKAKSGSISVNPAVSTMAGNLVVAAGGPRVVDPNHPLAGAMGTRASSHMVPRSGMNDAERLQQTMFGMVPGSGPVNQKIGQNPQIYMNERLPNVPGLTTVGGVSTGIVSGEAARWHAMMATLSMQSKAEIEALKKQIVATGVVSKDFMMQFDDILPVVSKLTDNAARESAVIVAELRAGKMTVEAAKAKIIALNLETERMIASAVGAQATAMGRTINPTMVPTLNQPVVDPTGKSNMRELFKKGKTRDFINKIAGALGVRTSGAGYNIETTVPKKFNLGGLAMRLAGRFTGRRVPGPNVNKDIVPAVLTPGEFVVNAEATRANLPLLQAINSARGGRQYRAKALLDDAGIPINTLQNSVYPARQSANLRSRGGAPVTASSYLDEFADPNVFGMANAVLRRSKLPPLTSQQHKDVNTYLRTNIDPNGNITEQEFGRHLTKAYLNAGVTRDQLRAIAARNTMRFQFPGTGTITQRRDNLIKTLSEKYPSGSFKVDPSSNNNIIVELPGQAPFKIEHEQTRPLSQQGTSYETLRQGMPAGTRGGEQLSYAHLPLDESLFMNMGGMVPGYNRGGLVKQMIGGTGIAIGGQMLGSQIGGGLGTAISMGSGILGSMYSFGGMGGGGADGSPSMGGRAMSKLPQGLQDIAVKSTKTFGPIDTLTTKMRAFSGGLSGAARLIGPVIKGLAGVLRFASPLGVALTALTAGVSIFVKMQKEKAKQLEIGRQAFGMDAEAASKAGFKYTDYNAKIKQAIENAQALKEKNLMVYESMTKANIPIKMTIEEYKKLKEQVKTTMSSYVELFDQTDRKDVGQVAVQLKAQFMAAGDSAEIATAKIFTMIKQSENANMAAQAISSNAFQSIQNMEQASAQTVKTFEAAMKTGDAESQARALHSVFMAMDATLEETISKQKQLGESGKASAEQQAAAVKSKLDQINVLFGKQAGLSKDVIAEIGKTDPLLAGMLNKTDTLNSAWAKYRLTLSGVSMNFQFMSGEAAIAANRLNEIVKAQVQLNPSIAAANSKYKGMTDEIKRLEKAQRGQSAKAQIDSRKVIEGLNKQIAAIRKAAQDKIDGIRRATEAENTQLEIQKAQLRAQQLLAQGNLTGYAEEQMTIEQLLNDANRKSAEEAIIAKAELDIKPLQDQLDALAKKNQNAADKASLAGESLSSLRTKADTFNSGLTEYTTNLNNLMTKLQVEGDKFKLTDEFKNTMAALTKMGDSLGIKTTPQEVLDQIGKALSKNQILAQQVNILTGKVRDGSMGGSGTLKDPFTLGSQGTGTKGDIQGASLSSYGNPLKDFGEFGIGQKLKNFAYKQGLVMGDYFSAEDDKGLVSIFKVKDDDGNITRVKNPYEKKALGGAVVAGKQYIVNDRVNALGTQGEGFIPNVSGTIYPNAATMPKFNMPGGTNYSGVNISNSPSSNNVYNIDIALNGTNVTADDVLRSFKRELALVNAREGIDRRIGGSV